MATSPLDRLHQRIKVKEDAAKVTVAEIDAAIKAHKEILEKDFKGNDADLLKRLKRINAFYEQLKANREKLYEAYQSGKLKYFDIYRSLRDVVSSEVESTKRIEKVNQTAARMRSETDPDREGGDVIDDYEGWGPGWIDDTTNAHNATRYTLSGYMTALELEDPALRKQAYGAAHQVYDHWTGSVLNYEELREDLKLGKYLDRLSLYKGLEDEPKGYLVGCYQLSENKYPDTDNEYIRYLESTLAKLINDGKLVTKETDETHWERGQKQMQAMGYIDTPKEWLERSAPIRAEFSLFKTNTIMLSEMLKFDVPADVQAFLGRNVLSITKEDSKNLSDFRNLIATKARAKFDEKKSALGTQLGEVEKKLKDVEDKNARLKKYAPESIKIQRDKLAKNKATLAAFSVTAATALADIQTPTVTLFNIDGDLKSSSSALDSMLAGLATATVPTKPGGGPSKKPGEKPSSGDVYKDKWGDAELVDGRWKQPSVKVATSLDDPTPGRDDSGKIVAQIPPGTELTIVDVTAKCRKVDGVIFVKVEYEGKQVWVNEGVLNLGENAAESHERADFIKEKNLLEIKRGGKYVYVLNRPEQSMRGVYPYVDFKNKDVQNSFGKKLNRYLVTLTDQIKDEKLTKKIIGVMAEEDPLKAVNKLNEVVIALLNNKQFKNLQAVAIILARAVESSSMEFKGDKPPSAAKLKSEYNKKFIPAWEKAGKKLDKLMKGKEKVPKGIAPGTKENPEVTKLLQQVPFDHRYSKASDDIMYMMKNPGKYPHGALVYLPLNEVNTPARVYFDKGGGGSVQIEFSTFPRIPLGFASIQALLKSMHSGMLLEQRQFYIIDKEETYGQYERYVGKLDDFDRISGLGTGQWTHRLEFDWEGTDPDIFVKPLRHGKIQYKVDYGDVAFDGEDIRTGVADNFTSFITIMKRYREWANRYDDLSDSQKRTEGSKERMYDYLVYPDTFRNQEGRIGRVVHSTATMHGVDMILDWGGGNNANSKVNARLQVWIAGDGRLNYRLYKGAKALTSGVTNSADDVAFAVENLKKDATKGKKSGSSSSDSDSDDIY